MQQGLRCNEDQDATRIKMQRGSRCNENQDATRIKMQRGSKCNEDQDRTRIKMQRESRCPGEGVSTSGSSNFTLRSSQSGANLSSFQPSSIKPVISPFSVPPPPLFTPHYVPLSQTPQYCQMPAANWGFCGGCHCWGPIIPTCFVQ